MILIKNHNCVLLLVSLLQRPTQISNIKSLAECKLQNLNITKWIYFLIHTSENTDSWLCSLTNGGSYTEEYNKQDLKNHKNPSLFVQTTEFYFNVSVLLWSEIGIATL